MVCRCLYILLRLGQICNSSTIDWISKDFAIAILSYCNFVGRQDFAFFLQSKQCLIWFRIRRSTKVDTIWPNCIWITKNLQSWPNRRELCLFCGIGSEWVDCRRIFGTAPEARPLFASNTDSHHHVCLAVVAISSIVVAVAWGCNIWSQSKSIYLNCTWIPNYLQLSLNPVDCKKRDPRLRQDFKIPKMALSAIVGVRLVCRGPSSMGWSLPSTPDQKPAGGPLG